MDGEGQNGGVRNGTLAVGGPYYGLAGKVDDGEVEARDIREWYQSGSESVVMRKQESAVIVYELELARCEVWNDRVGASWF